MNPAIKKITATLTLAFLCVAAASAADEDERVRQAGQALSEILNSPNGIPQDLLDKAACILVFPSIERGAFGVGGTYGRGVMVCRIGGHHARSWGPPALYALEGHGVKFSGGRNTDFILLVMNPQAARSLLSGRIKLGSQITAAAGPPRAAPEKISEPASAAILSYSRTRGTFAGVALAGSILRSDANADQKLYGKKKLTAKEIILDREVEVPVSARRLVSVLNSKSPSSPS